MAVDIQKEQPAKEMTPVSETPWEVAKRSTNTDLNLLKEKVQESKIDEVIDAVIDVAMKNKGTIPEAKITEFLNTLDTKEKQLLVDYLTGDDMKGKLGDLKSAVEKTLPLSPAGRIMQGINSAVVSMGVGDKLNAVAAKLGLKDGLGDQVSFVKNFLNGIAASIVERIAFMSKAFNPNIKKMLETSVTLRMASLGITVEADRVVYKKGYMKAAEKVKKGEDFTPPMSPEEAQAVIDADAVAKATKSQAAGQQISVTIPAAPSGQPADTPTGDATSKAPEKNK